MTNLYEFEQDYLEETGRNVDAMEADLLAIELGGSAIDEILVTRVLRAFHLIKVGAGSCDLLPICELADHAERAVAMLRARQVVPNPQRVSVLLGVIDKLRELIQSPQQGKKAGITATLAALDGICPDDCASPRNSGWPQRSRPAAGQLRALLAEDDFSSRLVLQSFLSRYGECHVAINGREAVAACRAALERGEGYHLICMDIMMPEMDGREAMRQIRAMEEAQGYLSTDGVKIIMTTTVDDIKEVSRCYRELCDGYQVKPINLSKLLEQMKAYELVP